MKVTRKFAFIVIFSACPLFAIAGPIVRFHHNRSQTIAQYLSLRKDLNDRFCHASDETKYNDLLTSYRKLGYYVPYSEKNDEILMSTIEKYLPLLKKKSQWISEQISHLRSQKHLPSGNRLFKKTSQKINQLLELKKKFRLEKNTQKRKDLERQSENAFQELASEYSSTLRNLHFLLSFDYPIDHLENRKKYDKLRLSPKRADRDSATDFFFARMIWEDGTYGKGQRSPDKLLRSTFDTLHFKLKSPHHFLPEDLRFDLEWAIKQAAAWLGEGRRTSLNRMTEWKSRVEKSIAFYTDLLSHKGKLRHPADAVDEAVSQHSSKKKLKEYVLRKQAEIYEFLAQKPEDHRALFSIETILAHEIGYPSDDDRLDRADIVQIVINRAHNKEYSTLNKKDSLFEYLNPRIRKKSSQYRWLNTLFKEGEFSFTYYYIPSSLRIFCSDQSRRGRNQRLINTELGFDLLKNPNSNFKGLRYFSRVSMLGKVNMVLVWKDYKKIPERPGERVPGTHRLLSKLKKGKYRYLYDFSDIDNTPYDVVEIDGQAFSVRGYPDKPVLFYYRNPHYFTYFR